MLYFVKIKLNLNKKVLTKSEVKIFVHFRSLQIFIKFSLTHTHTSKLLVLREMADKAQASNSTGNFQIRQNPTIHAHSLTRAIQITYKKREK